MNLHVVYLCIIVAMAGAFGLWLHNRDVRFEEEGVKKQLAAQTAAAAKQKEIDDRKFKEAGEQYAQDMADVAKYNFDGGASSVVCHSVPRRMPEAGLSTNTNVGSEGMVRRDELHSVRDVSGTLEVYSKLASRLAADARRLDTATH